MNNKVNCLICNTKFTLKSNLTHHLSNNKCKISYKQIHVEIERLHQENKLQKEENTTKIQQIQEIVEIEPVQEIVQLQFDGMFKGREKEIRITPNKQISVFDFIKVVGEQDNPRKT